MELLSSFKLSPIFSVLKLHGASFPEAFCLSLNSVCLWRMLSSVSKAEAGLLAASPVSHFVLQHHLTLPPAVSHHFKFSSSAFS